MPKHTKQRSRSRRRRHQFCDRCKRRVSSDTDSYETVWRVGVCENCMTARDWKRCYWRMSKGLVLE